MQPVRIETLGIDDYVREVLPETFELWGERRTFEKYVDDIRGLAESPYGRRRPFTLGLRESGAIVASCKTYDRAIRWSGAPLKAVGIGAVFTPPRLRGRGYATVMLGALLDAERAAGRDVAYLFSDIHPEFYARVGFVELPSRLITVRADSLDDSRVGIAPLESKDWTAVRRCFEAMDAERAWSLKRTPLVWDWMQRNFETPAPEGAQNVQLVVRRGRGIAAYAVGRRVFRDDAFVIDDFAYDGPEGLAQLPALFRAAAGDLRRVTGWLPPAGARDALPRGSVRRRKTAIFMLVPLSAAARTWFAGCEDAIRKDRADPIWDADHV